MNALDVIASLLVVVTAGSYLVWHLALRHRPPPCCATTTTPAAGANVVVHERLQRALVRAQRAAARTHETQAAQPLTPRR